MQLWSYCTKPSVCNSYAGMLAKESAYEWHTDGLVQDCNNSIDNALGYLFEQIGLYNLGNILSPYVLL